jgi:hypothetical protein
LGHSWAGALKKVADVATEVLDRIDGQCIEFMVKHSPCRIIVEFAQRLM